MSEASKQVDELVGADAVVHQLVPQLAQRLPHPDSSPVRPVLGTAHQRLADHICLELKPEPLSGELLRLCVEQAVADLRPSISMESLPEMATRLTLVRLDEAWAASRSQ